MNALRRFFIALLPPLAIQDEVRAIQEDFRDRYRSSTALKSPPHITLQAPFEWEWDNLAVLETALEAFATNALPVPVVLDGFGAFPPRVIYVNVVKTPELLQVQATLKAYLKAQLGIIDEKFEHRPFAPHMTVAFRDLSKPNFRTAWSEFESQSLHYEFIPPSLTLLLHDGKRWNVHRKFAFFSAE